MPQILSSHPRARRHQLTGFTMIELLVAVGVFFLLLTIILLPIRLAFDSLNIGRARSEAQQAAQVTMDQMERDLRRAVRILPNGYLPGVTTLEPYNTLNSKYPYIGPDPNTVPSTFTAATAIAGPCTANEKPMENLSRIDMVLPSMTGGAINSPVRPGDSVVTYYARRQIMDDAHPWDASDNPIVLFRAQFPFRKSDGGVFKDDDVTTNPLNADLTKGRFSTTCSNASDSNREALWISHNFLGEPNLEQLTDTDAVPATTGYPTAFASHTQVTPRGIALVARNAPSGIVSNAYVPDTTFVCEDSNGDGSIDRVTVNLVVANYAAAASSGGLINGQPQGQVVRLTRTIDCPNAS